MLFQPSRNSQAVDFPVSACKLPLRLATCLFGLQPASSACNLPLACSCPCLPFPFFQSRKHADALADLLAFLVYADYAAARLLVNAAALRYTVL